MVRYQTVLQSDWMALWWGQSSVLWGDVGAALQSPLRRSSDILGCWMHSSSTSDPICAFLLGQGWTPAVAVGPVLEYPDIPRNHESVDLLHARLDTGNPEPAGTPLLWDPRWDCVSVNPQLISRIQSGNGNMKGTECMNLSRYQRASILSLWLPPQKLLVTGVYYMSYTVWDLGVWA